MRAHRFVDSFLHRFAKKALAELLFEERHRHFTFAEPLHFDFRLRLGQLCIDLLVKLLRGQHHLIRAFQTFIQSLGDLHFRFPIGYGAHDRARAKNFRRSIGRRAQTQAESRAPGLRFPFPPRGSPKGATGPQICGKCVGNTCA